MASFLSALNRTGTWRIRIWVYIQRAYRKELSTILIPLPPLEEQRRIVAQLQEVQEKIKALKEAQAQTEAELKRLEQAILDKAFRGEL